MNSASSSLRVADYGSFGLRVAIGLMVALIHGLHKVQDGLGFLFDGTAWPLVNDVVELGLPMPVFLAVLSSVTQFLGGILLTAGILTRISAAGIASTMLVAVTLNLKVGGPDAELAFLYALVSIAFVFMGGGPLSLDEWRRRKGTGSHWRVRWDKLIGIRR